MLQRGGGQQVALYLYDHKVAYRQSGLQGETWRPEAGEGFAKEQKNAKPGWSLGKGERSVRTKVRAVLLTITTPVTYTLPGPW